MIFRPCTVVFLLVFAGEFSSGPALRPEGRAAILEARQGGFCLRLNAAGTGVVSAKGSMALAAGGRAIGG